MNRFNNNELMFALRMVKPIALWGLLVLVIIATIALNAWNVQYAWVFE